MGLQSFLDIFHHDHIDRHKFGAALGIPETPTVNGVADPGNSQTPARSDHVHPITVDSWHIISGGLFLNGWAQLGAYTVRYRKVNGEVELSGMVTAGAIGAPICNLPVGYRPATGAHVFFATTSNDAFCSLYVTDTGDVIPRNGSNVWVSLFPIRYTAEQ